MLNKIHIIITVLILITAVQIYAKENTSVLLNKNILMIKAQGTAFLGSGMSQSDAKKFAINDAKRNALEQAGTYIESHTTVLNMQIVKDEIITFAAGIIKLNILKSEPALINKRFAVQVEIEAIIDINILNNRIKEVRKNAQLKNQLIAHQKRIKKLQQQISKLQKESGKQTKQKVKQVINKLSASDWYEKALEDSNLSLEYFTIAIELDPEYSAAYSLRGITHIMDGNIKTGFQDVKKALEINSKEPNAYFGLATYYIAISKNKNQYRKLIEKNYNRAIDLAPNDPMLYLMRGGYYQTLNEIQKAVSDYNFSLKLGIKDPLPDKIRKEIRKLGYTPRY